MYQHEMALAKKAVLAAADYLDNLSIIDIDSLQGKDIKLEADRKSEQCLLQMLAPSGLPVLTEESGQIGLQSGLRWIIDPIDGTYNFFRGLKELSCVSVALWDDHKPVLGVVCRLGSRQLFEGNVATKIALVDDQPIKTSQIIQPDQAVLATGFPVYLDYDSKNLAQYIQSTQHFKKIRMLGTAALMSTFVGAGYLDVYTEKSIKLWDIAAGTAIALAAGGAVHIEDMENDLCHIALCANQPLLEKVLPLFFQSVSNTR